MAVFVEKQRLSRSIMGRRTQTNTALFNQQTILNSLTAKTVNFMHNSAEKTWLKVFWNVSLAKFPIKIDWAHKSTKLVLKLNKHKKNDFFGVKIAV